MELSGKLSRNSSFKKELTVALMSCAVNGSGEAQGIDLGMSLGAEEHTCSSRARSLVRYPKLRLHRRYWRLLKTGI